MPKTEVSRLGADRTSGHLAGQEGQRHFWAMVAPAFSTPAVSAPGHERQLLRNAAVAPAAMAREPLVSVPADAYSEFVGVNLLSQTDCLLDLQPAAPAKAAAFQMFSADPSAAALVEDPLHAAAEPRGPRGHAGPVLGFSPSLHAPRTSTGFPSGPKDSSCISSEGRRIQRVGLDGASAQTFSPERGHQGTSSQIVCAVSNLSSDASALAAQTADRTWEKGQPDLFSSGDSINTLLHQTREILSSFARSGQPPPASPERQEGSVPNPRSHLISRRVHGIQGGNSSSEAEDGDDSLEKQTTCHLGALTPSGFRASDSSRRSPRGTAFLTPEGPTSQTPQRFPSVCTPQRTLSLMTPQAIIAMAEPLGEEDTEDGLWLPEPLGPSAWSTGGACSLPTTAPDARLVDRGGIHRRMEGDEELKRRYAEHMQRIASIPTAGPGSRNLSPAASYIAAAAEAIAADFQDNEGVDASPGGAEECSIHEQTNGTDAGTSGDLRGGSRESVSSSKRRGLSGLPLVGDISTSGTNAFWEASVHTSCQLPRETEGLGEMRVSSGKDTWSNAPIGDLCAAPASEDRKESGSGKSSPVETHARKASTTTSHRAPTAGRLSEVYLTSVLQPTEVLLDRTAALSAAVANPKVYVHLAKAFHNQSARRDWTSDPEFAYSCTDSSCNGSVPCEIASPSLDLLPVFFASSRHAPEGLASLAPGVAAAAAVPAAEADSILHFCYRISLEPKRPAFQQIRLPSRANTALSQGPCLKCCLSVSLFPSRGDQSANGEQRRKDSPGFSARCKCRQRSSLGGDRRDEAGVAVSSTGAVEEHIARFLPFRPSFSASTKRSAVSSLGNISTALSCAPPLVFDGPPAFWGFEASPSSSDRSRESSATLQNACSDSEAAGVSPVSVIPPRFNETLGEDDVPVESSSSFAVSGKTSAATVLEAPGATKRRRVTACDDVASSAARTSTSVQSMLAQMYNQSFFSSDAFRIPATVFGFRLARHIAAAARDARITVSGTPDKQASLKGCTNSNGSDDDHLRSTCALLVLPEERSPDLPGVQAESGLSGKLENSTSSSGTSPTFVAPASPWERFMCCRDPPSRVSFVSSKAKLRLLPASGSVSRGGSATASTSVWGQKGDSGAGTSRPDEGVWVVRQAGTGVPLAVRAAVACAESAPCREGMPDSDGAGLLREDPEGGGTRRRRMSTSSAPGTPNRKLHSGRRPVSPAWRGFRGASRALTPDAAVSHQMFSGERGGSREGTAWRPRGCENGGTGEASRPRMMERFFLLDAHETAAAEPMPARLRRVRQMACSWFRNKKLQQFLYHWRRQLPLGADATPSERETNAPALPFVRASAFDGSSGEGSETGALGGTGTGPRPELHAPSVGTAERASEGVDLPLAILQEAETERGRVSHLHALAHALVSKLATVAEPLPLQATCCGCLLLSVLRSSSLAVRSRGLRSEAQKATANGDEYLVQGEEVKQEEDTLLSPQMDKEAAGISASTCLACSFRLGLRWREDAFAFEYFVAICRRGLTAEEAGREGVSEEQESGVHQTDEREAENRRCEGGGRSGESQDEVDATVEVHGKSSAEKTKGLQREGMRNKAGLSSTEGDGCGVEFKHHGGDVFSETKDGESAKDETASVLVLVHDVIQPCVFDFVSVQVAFRAVLSRLLPFLTFREECWGAFADAPEFRQLLASIAEQRGLCPEKSRLSEGAQRASSSSGSVGPSEMWKSGDHTKARSAETMVQGDPDRDDGGKAKRELDEMCRETSESPVSESLSFHDVCRLLRRASGTPCSLLETLEAFVQETNETHAPRAKPHACSQASARVLPSVCPPFTVVKCRRRPIGLERVLRQLLFSSQPSANPQTRGANSRLLRRGGGAAAAFDRLGASAVGRPLASDAPVDASGFQQNIQKLLEAEAFSVNCGYFSVPWSSSPPSSLKEDLFFAVFFPTQQALCCRRRMPASPGGLASEEMEEDLFSSGEETADTLSPERREACARRTAKACMRGLLQRLWPGRWPWREEAGEGLPLSVEEAWEAETGSQLLEEIERDSRRPQGTGMLSFKRGLSTASDGFEKRHSTLVTKGESLRSPLVSQDGADSREKTTTAAGMSMDLGERGAKHVVEGQAATFEVFDASKRRGEFFPFLSADADLSKDANPPSGNSLFFNGPGAAPNVDSPPEDLRWLLLPTASASLRTIPAAVLNGFSGAPSSSVPGDPSVSKQFVNDTDSSSASVASAVSPTLIPAPAPETSPPKLDALAARAETATSGRATEADRAAGSPPSSLTTPPQAAGLSDLPAKADDQSPTGSRHSLPRTAAGTCCDSTVTGSSRQPGSSAEDESSGAESVSAAAGPSWGTVEHDSPFQAKAGDGEDAQLKVRAGDGSRETGRPGGDVGSEVVKRRLWATDAEVTDLRDGLDFRLDWASDCDYGNGGSSESDADAPEEGGEHVHAAFVAGQAVSRRSKQTLLTFEEPVSEAEIFGVAQGAPVVPSEEEKPSETVRGPSRGGEGGRIPRAEVASVLREICSLRSPPALRDLLRLSVPPLGASGAIGDGAVSPGAYVSGGHTLRPRRGSDVSVAAAEQVTGKAPHGGTPGETRRGLSVSMEDHRQGDAGHASREEPLRGGGRETEVSVQKRPRTVPVPQDARPGASRGGLSLPAAFLSSSAVHANPSGYSPSSRGTPPPAAEVSSPFIHSPNSSGTPWSKPQTYGSLVSSPHRRLAHFLGSASLGPGAPGSPAYSAGPLADGREAAAGPWGSPPIPGRTEAAPASVGKTDAEAPGNAARSIAAVMSVLAQHVKQRPRQARGGAAATSGEVPRGGEGRRMDLAAILRTQQADSGGGVGGQRSPVGAAMESASAALLGALAEQALQATPPRSPDRAAPLTAAEVLEAAARRAWDGTGDREEGRGGRGGPTAGSAVFGEEADAWGASGALGSRGNPWDLLTRCSPETRQNLSLLLAAAETERGQRSLDGREGGHTSMSPGEQQRLLAATAALRLAALEAASRRRQETEPRQASCGANAPLETQLQNLKRVLGIGVSEGAGAKKAAPVGLPARSAPSLVAALAGEVAASPVTLAPAPPGPTSPASAPEASAFAEGASDVSDSAVPGPRGPGTRPASPADAASLLHGALQPEGGEGEGRRTRGACGSGRRDRTDSSSYSEDSHCEDAGTSAAGSGSGAPSSGGGTPRAGGLEEDELVPIGALPTGVYFDVARRLWRCQWREDGRLKSSGFSLKHYKTLEAARAACILYKCAMTNTRVDPAWMVPEYIPLSMASKRLVKQRHQAAGLHAGAAEKPRASDEDPCGHAGVSRRRRPADGAGGASPTSRGPLTLDDEDLADRRLMSQRMGAPQTPRSLLPALGLQGPVNPGPEGDTSPCASAAAGRFAGAGSVGLEAMLAAAERHVRAASLKAGALPQSPQDPRALLKLLEEASRQN
ncbi:AP2 domain transcription factor AP2VIII-4 [Toxoplasma gondii MAS]|uniref:AP2 domain transcription factor AP2VIII-4 n=1 Tax=Toxoplasma gondii MAS TaxID=943118 RepID=A0A086QWN4_TOXGO|nr:AP2 domain transcription factor AP2VIII-4 [Toxoplasma gondii MAS]